MVSQDTLDIKEVYLENELVYKYTDNKRFTGVVQQKRKNGQITFEEVYNDGVILMDYQYFKGHDKKICYKTIYNRYKLWAKAKEYYYPISGKWTQITSFDENGTKILVEQFEKDKIIYSCQYSGKKKNGKELCYDDDGNLLVFKYVNGKKIKKKNKQSAE